MKENQTCTCNFGLIILAASLLVCSALLHRAILRSGAIEKGMTPQQYLDWYDEVENLK